MKTKNVVTFKSGSGSLKVIATDGTIRQPACGFLLAHSGGFRKGLPPVLKITPGISLATKIKLAPGLKRCVTCTHILQMTTCHNHCHMKCAKTKSDV